MRSLRERLRGRRPDVAAPNTGGGSVLGTVGRGPVATVDPAGMITLRERPVAVDFWIGAGDRWVVPSTEAGVRQRRVEGLPVVETRVRCGSGDVVLTAWADEAGGGGARVIVGARNETAVPVALAVAVGPRPADGWIREARVVDDLVVVDRRPLVVLSRAPADVVVGSSPAEVRERLGGSPGSSREVRADDGTASLAAVLPLTPGVDQIVQLVDGRERPLTAPSPVERVVAGWKAHLADAVSLGLPGPSIHRLPHLISDLVLRSSTTGEPVDPVAGAAAVVALASAGLENEAAGSLGTLLDAVERGVVPRSEWPHVAAACGRVAALGQGEDVLARHPTGVVSTVGRALQTGATAERRFGLLEAVRLAAGDRAAADAAQVTGGTGDGADPRGTWLGGGDDAAALLDLLSRAFAVSAEGVDLASGFDSDWLGVPVEVSRAPTPWGILSYAIRWHGARPALLWELVGDDTRVAPTITASAIDPGFSSSDRSGEALLADPGKST